VANLQEMAAEGDSSNIRFGGGGTIPISLSLARRAMKGIIMLEDDLDRIANLSASVNYTFLGMSFGAWLTSSAALLSVDLNGKPYGIFVSTFIVSSVLSAFFGYKAYGDNQKATADLNKFKKLMTDLVVSERL
jgi:hypothetical protein